PVNRRELIQLLGAELNSSFHSVTTSELTAHLKKICKQEDIKYEPEALETIAKLSKGHVRDAIKLLEQANLIEVTTEWVYKLCRQVSDESIIELIHKIAAGKTQETLEIIDSFISIGANAQTIINGMSQCLQVACVDENRIYKLGGREFVTYLLEKINTTDIEIKSCLDANLALRSRIVTWCLRQDKTPPIYQIWNTPEEAFNWCVKLIPEMERSQMQEIFTNLSPINGSKARAWYFKVLELLV
ncbi:MAG: hypothetical protein AAFX80_16925, partial [Cyanobacteria bacterium J06639_18]